MSKVVRVLLCSWLSLVVSISVADEKSERPTSPFRWVGNLRNTMAHMLNAATSPDGKLLAVGTGFGGGHSEVIVFDLETKEQKFAVPMDYITVRCVAFSPDSQSIAAASSDRKLRIIDVSTGEITREFEGHTNIVNSVAFSPDGKLVVTGGLDKSVRVWSLASGGQAKKLDFPVQAFGVACSPDGKYIAACGQNANVILYQGDGSKQLLQLNGHQGNVEVVAFSPDSKLLASCAWDDSVILWNPADGSQIAQLKGEYGDLFSVCFINGGKHVVACSGSGAIACWSAESHELVAEFKTSEGKIWSVCPVGNGNQFATAAVGHRLKHW